MNNNPVHPVILIILFKTTKKASQFLVKLLFSLSRMTDSNPRPADYKSAALPTELIRRKTEYKSKGFSDSMQVFF